MEPLAGPVAPPQLSPDGHWWWDGSGWVPADQRSTSPNASLSLSDAYWVQTSGSPASPEPEATHVHTNGVGHAEPAVQATAPVAAAVLTIRCPGCNRLITVPKAGVHDRCSECNEDIVYRTCKESGASFPILARWRTFTHDGCSINHQNAEVVTPRPVRPKQNGPGATKSLTKGQKWGAGIVIAMVIGAISGHGGSSSTGSTDHSAAISACQDEIRTKLKSPASASFGDATVRNGQNGDLVINGPVDSENGFGANLRSAYVCTVDSFGTVTDSLFLDGGAEIGRAHV